MRVHDDLETLLIPIDTVRPYHKNPRQGDIGAISQSLEANGQYKPIVINRGTHASYQNEIVAGNHTWHAAKALGWDHIAATFVDVTDEQAARIVVVDNRTTDLATYDDSQLAGLLTELAASPDGLEGTGFSGDDLDVLLTDLGAGLSWEDSFAGGSPEGGPVQRSFLIPAALVAYVDEALGGPDAGHKLGEMCRDAIS